MVVNNTKKNPPNQPRHWRNGLGQLGGVRPIAGTNSNNDCREEGHNGSLRTPPAVHQRVPGTTPSRRRETRNTPVHGQRGPGSIAAGSTGECSCPSLEEKMQDARAQAKNKTPEAGKPRRKHRKRNTGKSHGAETPKPRPKKKQPLGQETEKQETHSH